MRPCNLDGENILSQSPYGSDPIVVVVSRCVMDSGWMIRLARPREVRLRDDERKINSAYKARS